MPTDVVRTRSRGLWHYCLVLFASSACSELVTDELSPQDPAPTRNYSGSALAYLTPSGLAKYEGMASHFASSTFPDDVPLSMPVSVVLSDTPGPPRTIGGGDGVWNVRVQTLTLDLNPTSGAKPDEALAARVEVSLYGDPLPVTGELPDCRVVPSARALALRIPLQVGRDVLGRIQVSVASSGASVIEPPGQLPALELSLVDCASLTPAAALDALMGPFLDTLLEDKAFTLPLTRTVATLVGARLPSRVTAVFPEGGELSVTLQSDINSADPPVLVSGPALIALPFSIGVTAVASACSGLAATLPAPITSPAPEGLTWTGADLVMTVRQDALDAIIVAALSAGGLCGVAPTPIGTLGEVLALAGGAAVEPTVAALPKSSPVVARLSWLSAPTMKMTESGEALSIRLASSSALVETFVRLGTIDHLLTRHSGSLSVSGLVPELRSDGVIALSAPADAQTVFDGPVPLAARVVARLAGRLALFPVPDRLPFPLATASFSMAGQHLVIHATFVATGQATGPESGALISATGASGCTASGHTVGTRSQPPLFWLIGFTVFALSRLVRRRRAL